MFGFLKTKDVIAKEKEVDEIGKALFHQISRVRELVRDGKLKEEVFNARFNSFFSVGYLVGFVDERLDELFTDHKLKKKYAQEIYNGIVPGGGAKWVAAKTSAYFVGKTIPINSDRYLAICEQISSFELGMSAGRLDMSSRRADKQDTSARLFQYLKTGQTH